MARIPLLTAVCLVAANAAWAAPNDADLIPPELNDAPREAPPERGTDQDLSAKIFVEAAMQDLGFRPTTPPIPNLDTARYQGWTSVDLRTSARVTDGLQINWSDRFDQDYATSYTPTTHMARNSLREIYGAYRPADGWFVDIGRINVRDGVAQGFNPTDFFKTGAVVMRQNLDPNALRDNRLGTLMGRVQMVGDRGSVTLIAAPRVTAPEGASQNQVFQADFDRTNHDDRYMAKASLHTETAFVPEVLAYKEEGQAPRAGVNLSQGVGDRIVLWNEWSGGRRPDLTQAALEDGIRTGLMPPQMPSPLAHDDGQHFQNQNALGASLSFESKLTVSLEWHYNQRAFTPSQWTDWYQKASKSAALAPILWQIRSYGQMSAEPMSRNELFARADWSDFIVTDLTWSAFTLLDPADASLLGQTSWDYFLDPKTTVGVRALYSAGGQRTEWGSQPNAWGVTVHAVAYF